jgi:hypothetical protein
MSRWHITMIVVKEIGLSLLVAVGAVAVFDVVVLVIHCFDSLW